MKIKNNYEIVVTVVIEAVFAKKLRDLCQKCNKNVKKLLVDFP